MKCICSNETKRSQFLTGTGILSQIKLLEFVATYSINGLGERVAKSGQDALGLLTGVGGAIHYAYDQSGHLLGEYDARGNAIDETVWLGDIPVAVFGSGVSVAGLSFGGNGTFYTTSDNLGSPHIIANSKGAKEWEWLHEPFGNTQPVSVGSFTYDLRFPGQIHDVESGLDYNMMRDYNPANGRYVESDPIGLRAGVNTYGYVGQNPITKVDSKGELWGELIGIPLVIGGFIEYTYWEYYHLSHIPAPPEPVEPMFITPNVCTPSNPNGAPQVVGSPEFRNYTPVPSDQSEPPEQELVPDWPETTKIPPMSRASYPVSPLPQPWSLR